MPKSIRKSSRSAGTSRGKTAPGAITLLLSATLAVNLLPGMHALTPEGRTVQERICAVRSAVQKGLIVPIVSEPHRRMDFANTFADQSWHDGSPS
jgi:hypothetical protein